MFNLYEEIEIVENEDAIVFKEDVNSLLEEGYTIESSSCNSKKYRAILKITKER